MKGIIDLDNVVSDWAGWVFSQQTEIPKANGLRSGRLKDMWPTITDDDVIRIVSDVRGYGDPNPIPGAHDGLWTLADAPDVELFYLSAAPTDALDARIRWLKRYGFPYAKEDSILGLLHLDNSENKISWIMEHGKEYGFIIDDMLSHLDAALLAGIPLRMVFAQSWNEEDENHTRVYSWAEAVTRVRSMLATPVA